MGQSLRDIAQKLMEVEKKVQLIYAFNGVGKTRLSREFRLLVDPKNIDTDGESAEESGIKIIYYNAFTEDLFYWNNDLEFDAESKLIIQPNSFTKWILKEQGQDRNIVTHFQHYTNTTVTPKFNDNFSEVTFSLPLGDDRFENIKISKGEESNFVWCVFYSLLEQVVGVLDSPEPDDRETSQFDQLKYVFIDDPVCSLDDNHLIELAVNLAQIIKNTEKLKFIISTHNPLFYNVLYNEMKNSACYMLDREEDGTFEIKDKKGDSNKSFSYHLFLKHTLEEAISQNNIQKYHFTLLRNLYEKTSNFLGYDHWSDLLPEDGRENYHQRIINFTSHSTLSNDAVAEPTSPEKKIVEHLLGHLVDNYSYWQESAVNE